MRVIGIEPDPRYVERARKVAAELKKVVTADIEVLEADPLGENILPEHVDTVILPRTFHELLLLHKEDREYIKKLAKKIAGVQKKGDKVLIADPNYRSEVNQNPQRYAEQIKEAIKKVGDAYGHFHPAEELPSPQQIAPLFEAEGYQLVETSWKANESTPLSPITGVHFTVFEKV